MRVERHVDTRRRAAAAQSPELRQVAAYALGFFGGEPARQAFRERLQGDDSRFVRYNSAVALGRQGDPAARETLREMLSTADLDRVIEIPSTTEKQNKIEAIELEALQALQSSLSPDRPNWPDRCVRDRRTDPVGTCECSQSGPGGFEKITSRALTGQHSSTVCPVCINSFDRAGDQGLWRLWRCSRSVRQCRFGTACALELTDRRIVEFVNLL